MGAEMGEGDEHPEASWTGLHGNSLRGASVSPSHRELTEGRGCVFLHPTVPQEN